MSFNLSGLRVLIMSRESLVAPGAVSLSVSARIKEVLDYLSYTSGLDCISLFESDSLISKAIAWADIVVLNKHRSENSLESVRLARSLGKILIYDIDDWIFSFPVSSGGYDETNRNYAMEIIKLCDCVTVSNDNILQRLQGIIPNSKLILVPNGIWVERYSESIDFDGKKNHSDSRRIVFTNADFLKVQESKDDILSALNVFFLRHPEYGLDFYGDPFPEMHSLPFLHFTNRMPYQEYIHSIIAGNYMFAITPLGGVEDVNETSFNVCKNPFKYINYGLAHIPGIYSCASIYKDCVQHEITGLLVENTYKSWLDAMEKFAIDWSLRDRVSNAAFADVARRYHISLPAQIFSRILEALVIKNRNPVISACNN